MSTLSITIIQYTAKNIKKHYFQIKIQIEIILFQGLCLVNFMKHAFCLSLFSSYISTSGIMVK